MTRGDYVPISAERSPSERARRMRTVAARLREHRNRRAGLTGGCEQCGGHPQAQPADRCDCAAHTGTQALAARCLQLAAQAQEHRP